MFCALRMAIRALTMVLGVKAMVLNVGQSILFFEK